jgi:hypothetical protein
MVMTLIVQPEIEHRDDRLGQELVVPESTKAPGGELCWANHASKAKR